MLLIKTKIKQLLRLAGVDLTKNMAYDRLTRQIMQRVIGPSSNCVDIGCHDGDMLEYMIRLSPNGKHMAFEPILHQYERLKAIYGQQASIYPYALANENGRQPFMHVLNDEAYSGLRKRSYAISQPEIKEIEVETRRFDDLISEDMTINFMKIDVEGAELLVMRGALQTIGRCKPHVVFEFGLGASDYYGVKPRDVFELLVDGCELKISTPAHFIKGKTGLTLEEFQEHYQRGSEYYFVAHP